jgi:hypothetical protein
VKLKLVLQNHFLCGCKYVREKFIATMGMPSSEEIKHDPSFHQLVVDQTLSFLPSAGRSFARRLRCVSQAHASAPHMDGEDETERQLAPVSRQDKRRGRSPSVHVHQAGFDSTDPGQAATTPCPVKSPSSCRAATTATAARRTARHLPRRPCQPSPARVKTRRPPPLRRTLPGCPALRFRHRLPPQSPSHTPVWQWQWHHLIYGGYLRSTSRSHRRIGRPFLPGPFLASTSCSAVPPISDPDGLTLCVAGLQLAAAVACGSIYNKRNK